MKLHLLSLPFFLLAGSALAQQFPVKNIVFTGYSQATKSELLATSELKEGAPLTQPQMQAAAKRLNDTGMFSSVSFECVGQTLNIGLQPAEGFLPVHYQNFPWWDEKTLNEQVHARVPLFHGELPPVSQLKDQVAAALTSMVAEQQHLEANIHGMLLSDPSNKPIAIGFTIEVPRVVVGDIQLQGVSTQEAAAVESVTHVMTGERYFRDQSISTLEASLGTHYRNQGYLDATFSLASSREPIVDSQGIHVPIHVAVTEGAQYHIGALQLASGVLMPQETFQKYARLHPGDVASEEHLRQTIAIVGSPYQVQGYIRAKVSATPTKHPAEHTVDYLISVTPGDVYRLRSVKFENLNDVQLAEVTKAWKLAAGAAYDASYPVFFLKKNAASLHALDGFSATYTQRVNEESHIVDLILTFHKGGPLS